MPETAPIIAAPVPIGSLPVATSSNPDDRIVIDGVTAGTRTILAANLVSGGADAPANFYSDWTFQAATTPPPGNGNVRWDNAISTSVTRLYIANLTNTGLDITTILGGLNVGMRIYQQDKNTSAQFAEWEITATPVPQTGYLEVPVALLAAGTTPNTGQVSILYFLAPSSGGGGGGASTADAVSVSPAVLGATNVQDALEALDAEVTTAGSVTVSPAVLGAANVQAALVALDAEVVTAGAVTVSPAVAGGSNVQTALSGLDSKVVAAGSVTVSPAIGGATNVQAALSALDTEIVTAGAVTVSPAVAGGSNVQAALAGLDAKVAPLPDIAAETFLARPQGAGTGPAQAVPATAFMQGLMASTNNTALKAAVGTDRRYAPFQTEFFTHNLLTSGYLSLPWWGANFTGAGTLGQMNSEPGHPGIAIVNSTTAVSGWTMMSHLASFNLQGGEKTQIVFRIPAGLTDFVMRFGWQDKLDTTGTINAAFLRIGNLTVDGFTRRDSTNTTQTSDGFPLTANVWYTGQVELLVDGASPDGWRVKYTVFDASGAVVWTNFTATNAPLNRVTGHGLVAYRSATSGAGATIFHVDYMMLDMGVLIR